MRRNVYAMSRIPGSRMRWSYTACPGKSVMDVSARSKLMVGENNADVASMPHLPSQKQRGREQRDGQRWSEKWPYFGTKRIRD